MSHFKSRLTVGHINLHIMNITQKDNEHKAEK